MKPVASALDDIANADAELETASDTEKESIVKSRSGQGKFRDNLLNYWSGCAVSGVTLPAFLRASHIKPWCDTAQTSKGRYVQWASSHTSLRRGFV